MKTVLITGGAGFIGSNFVEYMVNKYPDYNFIVLDLLTYAGSIDNLPPNFYKKDNFNFVYGCITNGELVDSLVKQSDYIVHFAAETHVTRSIYDNTAFFRTDVLGTQTIANAVCKYKDRVSALVHVSTSEVYGTAECKKMSEDHPLNPLSPYAAAKVGADRLVYSYYRTYGLPALIVRPFNNYGPKQHLEKAIPRFITSILLDEDITVHGDGSAARDFIYVTDTCSAIDTLMHTPTAIGKTFNVGSEVHRSIDSIADDIVEKMGKGNKYYIGDRPGQVFRHTADITKITAHTSWKPVYDWHTGLAETIDWYKANKKIWEKQLWMRKIPILTASGNKELH